MFFQILIDKRRNSLETSGLLINVFYKIFVFIYLLPSIDNLYFCIHIRNSRDSIAIGFLKIFINGNPQNNIIKVYRLTYMFRFKITWLRNFLARKMKSPIRNFLGMLFINIWCGMAFEIMSSAQMAFLAFGFIYRRGEY